MCEFKPAPILSCVCLEILVLDDYKTGTYVVKVTI